MTTMTHSPHNHPIGLPPAFSTYSAYLDWMLKTTPEPHSHVSVLLRRGLVNAAAVCEAVGVLGQPERIPECHISTLLKQGLINAAVVFEVIEPIATEAASAFLPFGLAAVAVLRVIKRAIDVHELREDVAICARELASFLDKVYGHIKTNADKPETVFIFGKLTSLLERVVLGPIENTLGEVLEIRYQRSRKLFARLNHYKHRLKDCRDRLPSFTDLFSILSQVELGAGLDDIRRQLDSVLSGHHTLDEVKKEIQSLTNSLLVIHRRVEAQDQRIEAQDRRIKAQDRRIEDIELKMRHPENFERFDQIGHDGRSIRTKPSIGWLSLPPTEKGENKFIVDSPARTSNPDVECTFKDHSMRQGGSIKLLGDYAHYEEAVRNGEVEGYQHQIPRSSENGHTLYLRHTGGSAVMVGTSNFELPCDHEPGSAEMNTSQARALSSILQC